MLNFNLEWSLQSITIYDYLLTPIYFAIIFLIAKRYTKRIDTISKKNLYNGLFFKISGGLGVCLIYRYYYGWGDTLDYYYGAVDLAKQLIDKPIFFFNILLGNTKHEDYFLFSKVHDWWHIWRDPNSYSVVRFTSILAFLGFNFYLPMTMLLSSISFIGIWRLFTIFFREFNFVGKAMAFSFLFIPSVVFWGSGLLKDTYTFSATCWMIYSYYKVFIDRNKIVPNVVAIIIMSYILISIRPFMLYIALVSIILMLTHYYLTNVKSGFIRAISLILILVVFWGGGITALLYVGQNVGGGYSIDNLLEKAAITQQDLSREYYGENSFNIGTFEPTIPGILSKAPDAINAGLFYPYIWKANNPVMLIAGLENLLILLLTIYVLILIIVAIFKIGLRYMLKTLFDHPLIIFSLSYAIPFAFMVGLTTANYGALVRYKIPLIPFYMASMFIIIYKFNRTMNNSNKSNNFNFPLKR